MLVVNLKAKTIKIRGTLEENFQRIADFWKDNPSLVNWTGEFKLHKVFCPLLGPTKGRNWDKTNYVVRDRDWTIVNIDEGVR